MKIRVRIGAVAKPEPHYDSVPTTKKICTVDANVSVGIELTILLFSICLNIKNHKKMMYRPFPKILVLSFFYRLKLRFHEYVRPFLMHQKYQPPFTKQNLGA
jgi:hypothetical protein